MRVFAGSLATETNTFSPLPTGMDAFREGGLFPAGTHPPEPQFFSGPLIAAREAAARGECTVVEGLVASAVPAGITTRAAWETLSGQLLDDLRRAMPVDVVLLGLHGAMVADGIDDCEGELLRRARELVGPDVVIGAECDPHTHLSDAMVANATLIVAFKEYPHTDILDRGRDLVALCLRAARGEIRPVPGVHDTGMIAVMHTSREPMRGFVERVKAMEGVGGVLSISPIHGFPWGDTPDMGSKVLVYADGDGAAAAALARRLGDELWGFRERLHAPSLSIDEGLDQALAAPAGTVVIADGADNAGGGAASDSTFVLRRMIERGIGDAALGPLWDPGAVAIAFNAGVGARLPLRIGGKVGPASGDPIDAEVQVLALARSATQSGLAGPMGIGDAALVRVQGIDVLLNTGRTQAMGTDLFTGLGCDLSTKRIVVVKSSQHFYAAYSTIASAVLYVQAPGTLTSDLGTLPYRKIRRPKWGV